MASAGKTIPLNKKQMRYFNTGATRDTADGKIDPEGYLSPLVIKRFSEYMLENQVQADGKIRPSDNWQKGIPRDAYMQSGFRHFLDWWLEHRNHESREGMEKALMGLLFNVMGYAHEVLKEKQNEKDKIITK